MTLGGGDTSAVTVDDFYERLRLRAATVDELLSNAFESGRRAAPDGMLPERRLAAWRRSSAAGDQALFTRRLERDGWTAPEVVERLATVRLKFPSPAPLWARDAAWIEAALQAPGTIEAGPPTLPGAERVAFEELLLPAVRAAEIRLWQDIGAAATANLEKTACAGIGLTLLRQLSELCAPALYERFARTRAAGYGHFVATMQSGGWRQLFDDKPVLLRLIAVMTRQWIEAFCEFVLRLAADLPAIRRELLPPDANARIAAVESDLADPHNGGRSVQIVHFADDSRVVYKPKDLRLDVAWRELTERLNRAGAPVALKAACVLARDGYGWSEFIAHTGSRDETACARFFHRAGAWLALFHLFAATDMHQENLIADGEHPVPVDLETMLQPSAEEHKSNDAEGEAFDAAIDIVANSVMTVGMLPAYGRSVDNNVFAMGGMTADWGARTIVTWNDINSDAMRPARTKLPAETNSNLPHVDGRYAKFADHIESFIAGFADYLKFLLPYTRDPDALLAGFAGLPVRRVIRPTRFYYMLLRRLKDHRVMDDGAVWSAQADFMARLAEWETDVDPLWPLQRAERAALLALNVPHFTSPSDGDAIADRAGASVRTAATPGLARARARMQKLNDAEIAWQIEVIRENTHSILPAVPKQKEAQRDEPPASAALDEKSLAAEADRIAAEIARQAIRRGPGAAWIGLDWLGDSEVSQLVCLGPDLYNGSSGIALFLAAHAAVTGRESSRGLALAALARLRKNLRGRNAARMARLLGIGGATGMGSIVYALAVTGKLLQDASLRADADAAAHLISDDAIAADKQLDVMGGSAGAILGLLRLYRDGQSAAVFARAVKCGDHLVEQSRAGADGHRSFIGQGLGTQALNGMSHGAAGFAYALSALAAVTGRDDFAAAASECMAFENASYDGERHNWPDLRGAAPAWPCQWCHGAPGIGLARLGSRRQGGKADGEMLAGDIRNAATGVERGPAGEIDTLCCGALGRIEFMCEAADELGRADLRDLAGRRLTTVLQRAAAAGDYRWNAGKGRFNLGLFRGLSGVGYTLLRQIDPSLPNVLIWE